MALVTITGYSWNYQRQAVINEERIAHSDKGWNYAACYETDNNKTYLIFTKEDNCRNFKSAGNSYYSLSARGLEYCLNCGTDLDKHSTGKLPIYC
jgi:hypothetical protein